MNKIKNIEVNLMNSNKVKEFIEIQAEKEHEESESAYISYKERNKLEPKHFLDQKRKSFPIRPGHECVDLSAALHRIGTYKGEMSKDALHSKIIRMMKTHHCALPEIDKPKNNK